MLRWWVKGALENEHEKQKESIAYAVFTRRTIWKSSNTKLVLAGNIKKFLKIRKKHNQDAGAKMLTLMQLLSKACRFGGSGSKWLKPWSPREEWFSEIDNPCKTLRWDEKWYYRLKWLRGIFFFIWTIMAFLWLWPFPKLSCW